MTELNPHSEPDETGSPATQQLSTQQLSTQQLSTQQFADATAEPGHEQYQREPLDSPDQPQRARLLDSGEVDALMARWTEIQVGFVDQPRDTVAQADALVADLMQRLASMFATEREQLEGQWSRGEQVSTEDLRQNLQRYRSFFERLLST